MNAPSKEATVFLVLLGCIVVVLIGYAVHSLATNGFQDEEKEDEISYEQRTYMRELRLRNIHWLARAARGSRGVRDIEAAVPINQEHEKHQE